jgi:dihydrofolate reductase
MKTIVYIGTSLDGFIARKNGDFEWLSQFANDEAIQAYEEFISRIDAIVIGRGTFEKVLSFPTRHMIKSLRSSGSLKHAPNCKRKSNYTLTPRKVLSFLSSQDSLLFMTEEK